MAINARNYHLQAPFIDFTTVSVLRMAHVHIREGVVDWYWTADPPLQWKLFSMQLPRWTKINVLGICVRQSINVLY